MTERSYEQILESQLKDLRESYAALSERHQGACQTAERLAPLACENRQLRFDCCVYLDRISRLETQVTELERGNRILREIAAGSAEINRAAALVLKEAMTR